jgi:hypothetical protein
VILYYENATYDSARLVWHKEEGVLSEATGAAKLDKPGAIEEEPPTRNGLICQTGRSR